MPDVDTQRIAAIGFCFGGTSALELAYSGADVKGIVTFHGSLFSPAPQDTKAIKAKILILHGADDFFTPADTIKQLQQALRAAKADWQMIYFGNAVHGFTNPSNGGDNSKGLAYNPEAAARSWKYMQDFFNDLFMAGPAAENK